MGTAACPAVPVSPDPQDSSSLPWEPPIGPVPGGARSRPHNPPHGDFAHLCISLWMMVDDTPHACGRTTRIRGRRPTADRSSTDHDVKPHPGPPSHPHPQPARDLQSCRSSTQCTEAMTTTNLFFPRNPQRLHHPERHPLTTSTQGLELRTQPGQHSRTVHTKLTT